MQFAIWIRMMKFPCFCENPSFKSLTQFSEIMGIVQRNQGFSVNFLSPKHWSELLNSYVQDVHEKIRGTHGS